MSRPLRIEFENAHYHVISRGDELKPLFIDSKDFRRYLWLLRRYKNEFGIEIFAYCLMNTHTHLGIKTPLANLSKFMQTLQTAYTVYYNLRHKRRGHLLQGRFKSILVDKDSYLLELSRYIHNQAVRAGICSSPEQYQWSSYRFFVTSQVSQIVSPEIVLKVLDEDIITSQKRYMKFVGDELGVNILEEIKERVVYGSDVFQEKIRNLIKGKSSKDLPEVRLLRRRIRIKRIKEIVADKLGINMELLEAKRRKNILESRDLALYLSRLITGETFLNIGKEFGNLNETVVSRRVKLVSEILPKKKELQALVNRIQNEI